VDRPAWHILGKRFPAIADIARRRQEPSEDGVSDGHHDGGAGRLDRRATRKATGGLKRDRSHGTLIDMALYFGNKRLYRAREDKQRLIDWRQFARIETHVENRATHGDNMP
jgi:hypothetical protein